jgi:DNA mismatch endonuclease (patch repair protein)
LVDVHDPDTRRRNMAAIRAADTKPELMIRRALHARGFRYRLHVRNLPGKPDLVLPRYRAAVFVHGCFWHGHECSLFRWPKSREAFWREKIGGNAVRDMAVRQRLADAGWRIATVWECALKGRNRRPMPEIIDSLTAWLSSDENEFLIEEQSVD